MTGDKALKACPFCGGAAEPEHLESGRWSVGCHDEGCIAYMSMLTFARRAEAATAWNTRSPVEDARGELVEALEVTRGTVGDLRKGFAPDVDPARWVEQLQAYIDTALSKSLPSPRGWQDIETAPHAVSVLACRFDDDVGEWVYAVVLSPPSHPYTHWKPLDAPPFPSLPESPK